MLCVGALGATALACSAPPRAEAVPTVVLPAPVTPPSEPSSAADAARERKPRPRQEALIWETSEPEARDKARRYGLPMIVYLRADWAAASLHMEREVWSDPRVLREGRAFVALKIDVTNVEGDAELYAQRYDAPAVPATVVLDAHGERVALLPGAVSADAVLDAMRKAVE